MLAAVCPRGLLRHCRILVAFAPALLCAIAAAQPAGNATRQIVDFIEELRGRGINVIYGNDLVPETLLMDVEAGEDRGLGSLEAALRPHGLTLRPGPRSSWLIVRAPEAATDEAEAAAVSPSAPAVFAPPPLETVVVSASRYAFARPTGPSAARLDREQLANAPTFGSDAIRATQALPGMSSSGLTARVNVRGGDADESLLFLDGVRLYNPFHLKDFQSLFSSISPQIVESMSVFTGAFPAEYGDRMSAVIDIEPIVPGSTPAFEAGLSTLTSSVFGSGRFSDGRGSWVTSARRGNLDLLIDVARTNVGAPRYVDGFGRVEYEIGPRLSAFGGLLALDDEIVLNDIDVATARAAYRDSYVWSGLRYSRDSLDVEFLASSSGLTGRRNGQIDDPNGSIGTLDDSREFSSTMVRVDWTWAVSDAHWLRGGIETRRSDASYLYASQRSDRVPILSDLPRPPAATTAAVDLVSTSRAFYLTYRARVGEAFTTEIGLRRDEQTLPADSQLSPRFNVLYDVNDRLSFRASWGRYYQAHGLNELQIGDGVTTLFPAQESEHTVFGVEYLMRRDISIRIEAYRKEFERLRPRFENLFSRVSLLPELQPDRVMISPLGGNASGFEISIEGGGGNTLSWWTNFTGARTSDALDGYDVDRSWEEPLAIKGGIIWDGPRWTVSLATSWHTGWPISSLALVNGQLVAGPLNSDRLSHFSSVDVRASRSRRLERGIFEWFVELNNALGKENPCCIKYDVAVDSQSQPISLSVFTDDWLPLVPTVGFNWRIGRNGD